MAEYYDASKAVDEGFLQQWYQDSIDEHLEELCNDFIVIPKEVKPNANVRPERHGEWIERPFMLGSIVFECSRCKIQITPFEHSNAFYCKYCGALMDGKDGESDG